MTKPKKSKSAEDVVVWIRLPKGFSLGDLKRQGLMEAGCYGGDTCIAATSPLEDAAVLVQGPRDVEVAELLRRAGLVPAMGCYGGNTCIV